jgi:GH18 family chitinase/chitodextrinase
MFTLSTKAKGLFLSLAAVSALYGAPTKAELDSMKKIVGYFPEWGIYSGHNNYLPANVPFDKVTHVNYAFATIKDGVIAHFDTYAATEVMHGEAWDSPYVGNLGQFEKLKKAYPHLSMMVSVGGWTQSGNFHDVAATQEARERFAASVVQYIRTYKMDGVDIDWEYPGSYREPDLTDNSNDQGTPKADESEKETFTLLLKTLRRYLDEAGGQDGKYYQLTAALSASERVIDFIEPSKFAQYLDFLNIMTYDMHGAWDGTTNHQSALFANHNAPDKLNVDAVVKQYLEYGVDPKKLVVGTPFYSRGWKGVAYRKLDDGLEGLFSQAQGGANGIWDGGVAGGMNPYYHLIEMEKDPSFTKYFDEEAKATYLYSSEKGEFYTYEDKRSLQAKIDYVKEKGLGGMIIWELSADAPQESGESLLAEITAGFYPEGIILSGEGNTTDGTGDTGGTSDDNNESGGEDDATDGGSTDGSGDTGTSGTTPSAWNPDTVYLAGDVVTYGGVTYTAKWWTQGDVPGADEWGPWEENGTGTDEGVDNGSGDTGSGDTTDGSGSDGEDNGTIDPDNDAESTWQENTIYTGGEVVLYNGVKYQAKWWTQGDVPGADEWGPWERISDDTPLSEGSDDNSTSSGGTDDGTQTGSGEEETDGGDTNALTTVSLAALQAREAELTDTEAMRQVKASIATLENEEVEKIVPLRAENPENVKRVEQLVSAEQWEYLFPKRSPEYTYENFLKAVGKFPAFCGEYDDGRDADAICRKSLATMFAHFTQETGGHTEGWDVPQWRQGLVHVREMGWTEEMRNGYNAECSLDLWQGQTYPCGTFEDGSFKSYFGRGAKQLSYNYNYGPFSEAMTGDVHTLLDHPELVADTWYNLASAVFFFVYPQPPKPSMLHVVDGTWQPNENDIASGLVPGFGVTTNIINGGVECGGSVEVAQSLNRIGYYREFAEYLGVPVAEDEVLGCAGMKQFSSDGAGALPVYWEEDWSWSSQTPDGRSYQCQLVNYQTPYSAFKEGDYIKCVEDKFDVTAE